MANAFLFVPDDDFETLPLEEADVAETVAPDEDEDEAEADDLEELDDVLECDLELDELESGSEP